MEIYDKGYLSEEEKNVLDPQLLIYMAISNYSGEPVDEILPRYVYKYTLQPDGTILRIQLFSSVSQTDSDVPWDTFINTRKPVNMFHFLFRNYLRTRFMDDDGNIALLPPNSAGHEDIPLDFVGRRNPYELIRPIDPNSAYFLTWVDDAEFLATLKRFKGENA